MDICWERTDLLAFRLCCLTLCCLDFLGSFPVWWLGKEVEFDCIDSWSLPFNLLSYCALLKQAWQKVPSRLPFLNTGHSRYVDFTYLDTTSYVEVIFHSQHFFSIFPCISTPSMSKTVNMKQWVSRGNFSCPRRIFYYICYCLCWSKNRRSHGRHIVCFGYVHVLAEMQTYFKQQ